MTADMSCPVCGGDVAITPSMFDSHQERWDCTIRTFDSGATRDTDNAKPDYEGYVSPLVTKSFGRYMLRHQTAPDGTWRAGDNWQQGIPRDAYAKSLCRHMEDLRLHHDGYADAATDQDLESVLCACLFNVGGYLYEVVRAKRNGPAT